MVRVRWTWQNLGQTYKEFGTYIAYLDFPIVDLKRLYLLHSDQKWIWASFGISSSLQPRQILREPTAFSEVRAPSPFLKSVIGGTPSCTPQQVILCCPRKRKIIRSSGRLKNQGKFGLRNNILQTLFLQLFLTLLTFQSLILLSSNSSSQKDNLIVTSLFR